MLFSNNRDIDNEKISINEEEEEEFSEEENEDQYNNFNFDNFVKYPKKIKKDLIFGLNKNSINKFALGYKYGIGYNKNNEILYFSLNEKNEQLKINTSQIPSESRNLFTGLLSNNIFNRSNTGGSKKDKNVLGDIFINTIGNIALIDTKSNLMFLVMLYGNAENLKNDIVLIEKNKINFTAFNIITNYESEVNFLKIKGIYGNNDGCIYSFNLKFKNKKVKDGFDIEIKKLHEFKFVNNNRRIFRIDTLNWFNDLKLILIFMDSGLFYFSSKILSFKKILNNIDDKKYNKHLIIKNKTLEENFYNICYDNEKRILYNITYFDGKKLNYIKFDEDFIDIEKQNIKDYIIDKGSFEDIDNRLGRMYGKITNLFSTRYNLFIIFRNKISIIDLLENEFKGEFQLEEKIEIDLLGNYKNKLILNNEFNFYDLYIKNEKNNYWIKLMNNNFFKESFDFCIKNNLEKEKSVIGKIYLKDLLKKENYKESLNIMNKIDISFDFIMYKLFNKNDKNEKKTILILNYLLNRIGNYNETQKYNKEIILCFIFDNCIYKMNELEKLINLKKEDTNLNINIRIDTKDYDNYKVIYNKVLTNHYKDLNLNIINYIFNTYNSDEFIDFSLKVYQLEVLLNYYLLYNKVENSIKTLKIIIKEINKKLEEDENDTHSIEKLNKTIFYLKNFSIRLFKNRPFNYIDLISYLVENKSFTYLSYQQIKEIIYFSLSANKIEELTLIIKILKSIKAKLLIKKAEKEIIMTIGNYLVFLLTKFPITETLEKYLLEFENYPLERFEFNINFALFLFKDNSKLIRSKIILNGLLKNYEESVKLSLQYDFLDLAKYWSSKPKDNYVKKKLWLNISLKLLNQNNNKSLIELLKEEKCFIGIEDLIPYFDNESKIKDFQEEITNSLNYYNKDIKKLKSEMIINSENSNVLRREINELKNKYYLINYSKICDHCNKNLFDQTFFYFPCSHAFHKKCSMNIIENLGDNVKLDNIKNMKENLKMEKEKLKNQKNIRGDQNLRNTLSVHELKELEDLEKEIDDYIGNECYYCGELIIEWAFKPFEKNDISLDFN